MDPEPTKQVLHDTGLGLGDFIKQTKEPAPTEKPPTEGNESKAAQRPEDTKKASEKPDDPQEPVNDPFYARLKEENFKHRKEKRDLKQSLTTMQKEVQKLKDQINGTTAHQDQMSEEQKAQVQAYEAKVNQSKRAAIKKWSEDTVHERFLDDGSPWKEVEQKAAQGDPQCYLYNQRVMLSDDPFATADEILKEMELLETHKAGSVLELVDKVKAKAIEDYKHEITQQVNGAGRPVGKPVNTLGSARGGAKEEKTNENEPNEAYKPFSKMSAFAHLS